MPDHDTKSAVAREALEWFVLNRGDDMSAEQTAAFGDWLKSSPQHVEQYLRTAVMSQNLQLAIKSQSIDMGALIAEARAECASDVVSLWPRGNEAERESDAYRPNSLRFGGKLVAAAAAVLILIGAFVWVERDGQRFGLPKEFDTGRAEQRSWMLPDGSGLDLNAESAVLVHYSGHERTVRVIRGEALFQVAHESTRRFSVITGRTAVIAIGTEFDVQRRNGSTIVTVVQGRVAVFNGHEPPPAARATLPAQALSVSAGQQVSIDDRLAATASSMVVTANIEQAVAWTQHEIAFDRQPLEQVAEEFNRYTSVPIVIASARLRTVPISGVLNEYDADSFLAFIAKLDGVEIKRFGDRVLVIDRPK